MQLKEYQQEAIQSLDRWLEAIHEAKAEIDRKAEDLESIGYQISKDEANFPKHAWQHLQQPSEYVSRTTDSDEPIPHICLKVPTGGGKTLLGAASVERILMHSGENTGLLLWIVPTRAIYEQTRATLWNRQHPYRQILERACGGRVKVMEKDDALTSDDIRNYLCVMLLMLPSANRQKSKDFLRMFRDSGKYPGFFPENDHPLAQGEFREKNPDLEREPDLDGMPGIVKQSLFNVFKICRPVVILDEAHKAYGKQLKNQQQYARAVNRMNPGIVIELSATPNHRISNVLVDIRGAALQAEEMIKLPINIETRGSAHDWTHTLELAHQRLEDLTRDAEKLEDENGRYIRPIAVVRVERTGKKQRDHINIHAEDARDHLISIGVQPDAIKVKSSETDELGREDLMNERTRSPVRWIITKDALKEGWDCPFAYILVLLDNTRAKTAITQMVGRVLRMPHVRLTGRSSLDSCYVICHNAEVRNTVDFVRNGLENEGMGDLGGYIDYAGAQTHIKKVIRRTARFRGKKIYLPKVLHKDGDGGWRDLDYDRDILAEIDWSILKIDEVQARNILSSTSGIASVGISGELEIRDDIIVELDDTIDIAYFARRIGTIVPNPWRAAHLAQQAIDALLNNSSIDGRSINASRARYAEQFRAILSKQIDQLAQNLFIGKFDLGDVRFDLSADEGNYELGHSYEDLIPENAPMLQQYAQPVQRTLFEPALEKDFNSLERDFAFYLDSKNAILWWHRVAARQRGSYFLRGWRRDRIFPDFVAIASKGGIDQYDQQLLLYETKGAHLKDSEDTRYKSELLSFLQKAYNGTLTPRGTMTLRDGVPNGVFRMVFEGGVEDALAGTLADT